MKRKRFETVDEYVASFPDETRAVLRKIRATIRQAAPAAGERISYGIPTFTLDGKYLVYFAGFENHVSIYPIPTGTAGLRKEMEPYIKGKGTLRFPLDRPVPYGLIKKIALAHLKERRAATRR